MTLEELNGRLNEDISGIDVPLLFPDSSQSSKELLPPAPANRVKYATNPFTVKPLVNIKDVQIKKNELYKVFSVSWGAVGASSDITEKHMQWYAEDWIKTNVHDKNEIKYIDIVSATTKEIVFRFAIERWLYDNFQNVTPHYRPVAMLDFPLKADIPQFFYDNTNRLIIIILDRFKQFISTRPNKLLNSNFSFLKKVDVDMFDFKFDHTRGFKGTIVAGLHYTVAMGALAIYTSIFFNKHLTNSQEDAVKKSASRFSDIDNLNRFLKNLK